MTTDPTADSIRLLALEACARVMRDADAKPTDILRAAEIVAELRAEGMRPGASAAALSDADLLTIARGEGGRPPREGPAGTGADAVPSHARTDQYDPSVQARLFEARHGNPIAGLGYTRSVTLEEMREKYPADTDARNRAATRGLGWGPRNEMGPKGTPEIKRPRGRPKKEVEGPKKDRSISSHIAPHPKMDHTHPDFDPLA